MQKTPNQEEAVAAAIAESSALREKALRAARAALKAVEADGIEGKAAMKRIDAAAAKVFEAAGHSAEDASQEGAGVWGELMGNIDSAADLKKVRQKAKRAAERMFVPEGAPDLERAKQAIKAVYEESGYALEKAEEDTEKIISDLSAKRKA